MLAGVLWLKKIRSPHAHAKIARIDTAAALATTGVLAVIIFKDIEKYNLHLMLTLFFFFKQKTAYEISVRDWSSDVCSSDLVDQNGVVVALAPGQGTVQVT